MTAVGGMTQAPDRGRLLADLGRERLIAIARNIPEELIDDAATAMLRGGIRFMEVTLNREDAFAAIRRLAQRSDEIHVGAGTVLTLEQLERAVEAGASYIISPHTDPVLIRRTRELGLVAIPGAYTPTEIQLAHAAGADYVKLFPASEAGCGYIRALRGPLPDIRLLAVGGVALENMPDFIRAGIQGFGIGSDLLSAPRLLAAHEAGPEAWAEALEKIERRSAAYVESVRDGFA
ncbi:MAG: bifunctional 4-hydroxy-2-oxoglutarate aldolase/2-dehydro-3-deoxy-phosphogluconate aldolase [Bacillota bacterium]|nr:bifunctional 4-hydroxy-2-oxoglutarate aldolase/2-dehydro-3-deoxy-phosphogluconate aldolase [Bacillota bacterium]